MSKSNFYVYDKASGKYNLQGVLTLGCCTEGAGGSGGSAYDVAVNDGFMGTEGEWLESLKGSKIFLVPPSYPPNVPPEGARVGDLVVPGVTPGTLEQSSLSNYGGRWLNPGDCAPILSLDPFEVGDTLGNFTGRVARWLSGNGTPGAGIGYFGDWYINLNNGDVWEKLGVWMYDFNIFTGEK